MGCIWSGVVRSAALLAAMVLALAPGHALAALLPHVWSGRVVAVHDGDTVTVVGPSGARVKVRLAQIDAPERGQPWGARSRELLSGLVLSRQVRVEETGKDRYGRTVARLRVGPLDVNAELVRDGGAWAYGRYVTDPAIPALQRQARASGRGLWSMPAAQTTAPWDWRASRRPQGPRPPVSTGLIPARAGACAVRRLCREMSSCAEARARLARCGPAGVDGDGDGIPCEALCRGG